MYINEYQCIKHAWIGDTQKEKNPSLVQINLAGQMTMYTM